MLSFVVLLTAGSLLNAFASDVFFQDSEAADGSSRSTAVAPVDENPAQVTVEVDSEDTTADAPSDADENSEAETTPKTLVLELSSSAESGEEDGEAREVKVRGQVIVIGPDGQKKWEYNFDEAQSQDLIRKLKGGTAGIRSQKMVIIQDGSPHSKASEQAESEGSEATWVEERFVIGIQCTEADELLKIHLRLGEKGVVVINVRENTPAASGGLQKNDIIVSIDDRDVVSREDLTKAVLESEGKPLSFSVLRAGEPQTITVTPTKMKVPVVVASAATDEEQLRILTGSGESGVRLQLVHPGIMLERGVPRDEKDFRMMIEQFQKSLGEQAAKGQDQHHNAQARIEHYRSSIRDRDEHLHESLKVLQDEVRKVQKELMELKQQIIAPRDNQ